VLLAAAWLLSPILAPTHVEGFSASIVSLALHLNQGRLSDFDRLNPANLEYFVHSRLGTVLLESTLTGPLRIGGDTALRLITWSGFVALVVSSFLLARRWSESSAIQVVVLLLLTPAIAESAFFYDDTIFAAALGVGALAIVTLLESTWATIGAGLLLGTAVVARLDAVLLAPAVAVIGYQRYGLRRRFWARAAIFAASVALPVLLLPAVLGTNVFHIYEVTSKAVRLWGEPVKLSVHARELAFYVGMPVMILVALGVLSLFRRREFGRLLLLAGVPALFNLVALGKIWQSRQLLPMTPFFIALAAIGWQHIAATTARDGGRLRAIVIAICIFVLVAPPFVIRMSDGPRAPYGRLWSPLLWMRWQSAVRTEFADIREFVANRPAGTSVVLTDTWNGDRYLHLTLQQAGYVVTTTAGADSTCGRVAEILDRGNRRVVHIRLHQPFLHEWRALSAARLERWGAPCISSLGVMDVTLLTPFRRALYLLDDSAHSFIAVGAWKEQAARAAIEYDPQTVVTIPSTSLGALQEGLLRDSHRDSSFAALANGQAAALARADSLMRPRVWKSEESQR
jgi:hypothetical protein